MVSNCKEISPKCEGCAFESEPITMGRCDGCTRNTQATEPKQDRFVPEIMKYLFFDGR